VTSDLPLGPQPHGKDRFTAIWGEDAEEAGPFGAKANVPTKRHTFPESHTNTSVPLNPHLKQVKSVREQEDSVVVATGLSPRPLKKEHKHGEVHFMNFRELVHQSTGIKIKDQRLFHQSRVMRDDDRTLAEYGIGQGSVIMCQEMVESKGAVVDLCYTSCKAKLFEHDSTGLIRGKLGSLASSLGKTRKDTEGTPRSRIMLRWNNAWNDAPLKTKTLLRKEERPVGVASEVTSSKW
jgi:hypothetical protein